MKPGSLIVDAKSEERRRHRGRHHKMMLDHYTQCKNIFMSLTDTKVGLH